MVQNASSRTAAVFAIVFVVFLAAHRRQTSSGVDDFRIQQESSQQRHLNQNTPRDAFADDSASDMFSALTEKLNTPREFSMANIDNKPSLTKTQFLHLHHMKTGTFPV
jgi:hypothetical protein